MAEYEVNAFRDVRERATEIIEANSFEEALAKMKERDVNGEPNYEYDGDSQLADYYEIYAEDGAYLDVNLPTAQGAARELYSRFQEAVINDSEIDGADAVDFITQWVHKYRGVI